MLILLIIQRLSYTIIYHESNIYIIAAYTIKDNNL